MNVANPETRLVTLDALRGFAVMGILAMNIVGFAMPEWAYISPSVYGGETLADRMSWILSFIFIDGKMRGLFSLLFGASMVLIIERAEAKGENAARVHYIRMFWLALFGLAHYFFVWFGDILFLYAAIGCLAFRFQQWEPDRLIKWALIIYSVGFLIWGLQFGGLQVMQWFATMPDPDPALARQYREMMASGEFAPDVAKEIALYRGGYWPIVADKLSDWHDPFVFVFQSFAETLPLMMLGMALKKNGFLTGQWARVDYARWARKLVPAGLLLNLLIALWVAASGYDVITSLAAFLAWTLYPRLMLTVGYAALLLLAIERLAGGGFFNRVAAAGRAAFSNYLFTSLIMTAIFYGYGLGLFGDVDRASLWFFVLPAWALMLLWSKPWLERFRYGPLEWLWRSLARGKLQPWRH